MVGANRRGESSCQATRTPEALERRWRENRRHRAVRHVNVWEIEAERTQGFQPLCDLRLEGRRRLAEVVESDSEENPRKRIFLGQRERLRVLANAS